MSESVLLVELVDDATAILMLNRPHRRNALTVELMQELCAAINSLVAEPQRRVAILRGAGPAFCSGLDLNESADTKVALESADWVARTFETLLRCPLVTIAAAHGAAFAGGGGLLACCDFAIASDDLQIGFPEVRRGLIPALVAAVLQDRLRDGDVRELLLIGEPISAERAREMGLVNRIVPADRVLGEACLLASKIVEGGPGAVRHTKQWLHELRSAPRAKVFTQALDIHKQIRQTPEATEGLAAFLEHRDPQWPAP